MGGLEVFRGGRSLQRRGRQELPRADFHFEPAVRADVKPSRREKERERERKRESVQRRRIRERESRGEDGGGDG